jgi:hypothetical protein
MAHEPPTPVSSLSATDHGDDMQLRVRYQATYGAWLALTLLIDQTAVQEVYCEQHEDVLLRKTTGKFQGCQVKTRLPKLGPFKTDDSQIKDSISRFIELEKAYRGHFERFIIATNVAFWQSTKNSKNLPHLIEIARSMNGSKPPISNEIRKLINEWCDKHSCDRSLVWKVLGRLELQSELPQFHDIESQLAFKIAEVLGETFRRVDEVSRAAKALVQMVSDASSRNHTNSLFGYFVFVTDPPSAEEAAIIAAKKICKDDVLRTIRRCFDEAVLLTSGNHIPVSELPRGTGKLKKKLAAGGLSIGEIDLLKSFHYSADVLLQQWLYKYGPSKTSARYEHLRLIVTDDCYEAAASAGSPSGIYGAKMLARVRSNLKQSVGYQLNQLSEMGVTYNHLLGIAGILTEDCKVWWSDQFELEEREEPDAAESIG